MGKKSATYSAKTDKHDEHKHLFGSGGKSDFIINMTPEGAQKLCGIYSIIAMILLALSSVPYYLSRQFGKRDSLLLLRTENNSTLAFLIMTFLIITGFICNSETALSQNSANLISASQNCTGNQRQRILSFFQSRFIAAERALFLLMDFSKTIITNTHLSAYSLSCRFPDLFCFFKRGE